jgi:hypothetical protein
VVFLTLTVLMASQSPDKFFEDLSPQNRVDSLIRAIEIIDGTSLAEDSCPSAQRAAIAREVGGLGHYTKDISFISGDGEREPARGPSVPPVRPAGGTDTVARE